VPLVDGSPEHISYVRYQEIEWSDGAEASFAKYRREWSANALSPAVACDMLEGYLTTTFLGREVTPIGHNVGFDRAFLARLAFKGGKPSIRSLSHRAVDTHTILWLLHNQGRLPSTALTSSGAFEHFAIEVPEAVRHTALGDARATRQLVLRLLALF
jgi:DNA polymerase III subunit epsilon